VADVLKNVTEPPAASFSVGLDRCYPEEVRVRGASVNVVPLLPPPLPACGPAGKTVDSATDRIGSRRVLRSTTR
jgi:hypothetical protein